MTGDDTAFTSARTARKSLTVRGALRTLAAFSRSARARPIKRTRTRPDETHLSAKQGAPQAHAWLPGPHGHQEGPPGPRAPASQGSQAPHSVRHRAEIRSGPSHSAPVSASAPRRSSSMFTRADSGSAKSCFRRLRPATSADSRVSACRSRRARWAMPWRAIASAVWCGKNSGWRNGICRRSTSSSAHAPRRGARREPSCAPICRNC